MTNVFRTAAVALALVAATATADDKSDAARTEHHWSTVGDIVGEIQKLDGTKGGSITLRVHFPSADNSGKGGNGGGRMGYQGRGTVARSPQQLQQHLRSMMQLMLRQQNSKPAKDSTHDFVLKLTDDVVVRTKELPDKLDEKGNPAKYTPEELQKLKGNPNLPGYAAELP